MIWRGLVAMVSGFALMAAQPAFAQSATLQYPAHYGIDRGGFLGLTLDTTSYTHNGINVVKVLSIDPRSGLNGVLIPGDFIYGVNGFNLHDSQDIISVVSAGSPGTSLTVFFLDSRRGYAPMQVTTRLITDPAAATRVAQSTPSGSSSNSPSFCAEHYILCGVGAIVGVAVVASALSGSGSSASSGNSGSSGQSAQDTYYRRQTYTSPDPDSPSSTPPAQGCSYGLYGNSPGAGMGYGC